MRRGGFNQIFYFDLAMRKIVAMRNGSESCLHQFITQLSRPVIGWWRLWNENIIGLRDDAGDEGQVTERKDIL